MYRYGMEYLSEIINSVICNPNIFRIRIDNSDKYIFSITTTDTKTSQWYAVAALYDSICEIDHQIKYAFDQVKKFDLPTTLEGYDPFISLSTEEYVALYHTENIVFRVSVLWDLLAQICNVIYETGYDTCKIFYGPYFQKYSKGEKTIDIAKRVTEYLDEEDSDEDINPWPGNHKFLNEYRNQMTHRVSPNITSFSTLGTTMRPPIMYVLHRALEDYYKASEFLCEMINIFLEERRDWMPIGLDDINEG